MKSVYFLFLYIFFVFLFLFAISIDEIRFTNEQELKEKITQVKESKVNSDNFEELNFQELRKLKLEERNFRNAATNAEEVYGKFSKEYAKSLHTLGGNLYRQKQYDQSFKIAQSLVLIHEKLYGVEDFQTAQALGNLGVVAYRIKKMDECRLAMDRALYILLKTKGEQSKEVLLHRGKMMSYGLHHGETGIGISYEDYKDEL